MSFPQEPVELRVRYAETDQMGVAYHTHYLVWCEMARTDFMRRTGVRYRDLEAEGLRLAVTRAAVRYRRPARYDDLLRVYCWVRDVNKRQVTFGYLVRRVEDDLQLATAETTLTALDANHQITFLPAGVVDRLQIVPDPVRI